MLKTKLSIFLVFVLIMASIVGCSSNNSENKDNSQLNSSDTSKNVADKAVKKVLNLGAAKVDNLDFQVESNYAYDIAINIQEQLVAFGKDGKLEPLLLTKMPDISADGKTYSFELKPGVKFHNGEVLKSSDVKATFERILSPATESWETFAIDNIQGAAEMMEGKATELSGFKITDDTHFEITLTSPNASFLAIQASNILICSGKALKEAGKDWGVKTLVGTGPYKLVKNETETEVILEKYTDYHGTPAIIDQIVYKVIPDANTRLMEYEKGNLDIVGLKSEKYPEYSANPEYKDQIISVKTFNSSYIWLNHADPLMKQLKVRQAISLAIDRNKLVSFNNDTIIAATSLLAPGMFAKDENLPSYEYNIQKAKQLLAEAGYPKGIQIESCLPNGASDKESIVIQSMLKEAGIDFKINKMDMAVLSERIANGDWQTAISGIDISINSDPDIFVRSTFGSIANKAEGGNYSNKDIDKMLEQAKATQDEAARAVLYAKIDKMGSCDDFAVIPLYHQKAYQMVKPYIIGTPKNGDVLVLSKLDIENKK